MDLFMDGNGLSFHHAKKERQCAVFLFCPAGEGTSRMKPCPAPQVCHEPQQRRQLEEDKACKANRGGVAG